MEHLHTENYPGKNGEDFVIKIFDYHSKKETAINLAFNDNGEDREVNITRSESPADSELKDLIEKAKRTADGITIIRGL